MDPKPPIYESVSSSDDHEELLSSTEVDESVVGEEKPWYTAKEEARRRSRTSKLVSTLRSYRWLIDFSLLLVILGLLVFLLLGQRRDSRVPHWQVGDDFTGAGPKCMLYTRQDRESAEH
jgi:hypothetical protein